MISTGLLAYGTSGKVFHAPFLHQHAGFNFCAVVERNRKQAQQDYPHLTSYNAVEALWADEQIELVIVNTPNYLHYEHIKAALEHGKHVLADKPLVATVRQAEELFRLADRQNRKLLFYQNRRWDSDFMAVKQVVQSSCLGKLNELHIRFDRYKNTLSPKRFREEPVAASGLSYDLGPHLLDQAISLFGKPQRYHKVSGKNRPDTQVDDYFFIQLSYPNDLNVTVASSLLVADPQPAFILHGTQGSFIKPRADVQEAQLLQGMLPDEPGYGVEPLGKQGKLTLISSTGEKTEEYLPAQPGNYMALFEAVYQTLVHQHPYPVTREDILTQLEILEH